jgi:lipopolysaccharide export LptBFGC system permease protein LptF
MDDKQMFLWVSTWPYETTNTRKSAARKVVVTASLIVLVASVLLMIASAVFFAVYYPRWTGLTLLWFALFGFVRWVEED